MKRLTLAVLALGLPLAAAAAPESYTIDPYHSFPYFTVNHLGFANMMGRFDKTSGKIVIDTAAKTGTVEIAVETASVNTGDNERGPRPRSRDEHLRTADFFNSAEFPRMTYKGTASRWSGDAPTAVEGQLTLLGVSKPLALTVEGWKCGPDPRTAGKRYMCAANASGQLKRSDFGMNFGLKFVGDDIRIFFLVEAFRD
jgi:polyisoprenoid-binding protein YceI